MLDLETIKRLLETSDPAISIYFRIEPEQRDVRAPNARFRELLDEAAAMMRRDGLDQRRIDQLLAPIRQLEADFARHRDPALAIFSCDRFTIIQQLPRQVADSVTVSADFHIKPLLPFLASNRHFYVLALSKTKVRLLAATPFTCQEVPLEQLPADAQAELDSEAESGGITDPATASAERLALLMESPKRIAAAAKATIGNDPAPILLVADPREAGHFMKETNLPTLLPEPLAMNPFSVSESELLTRALERVEPLLSAELDTVLDQMNARLGTAEPTVAIKLEEILHAAQEGRVDTLVVAEDETLWGHFSPEHVLTAHGRRGPHDEDLLNQAVVSTLRNGGQAFAAPHQRLPRQVQATALLRF